MEHSRSSPDISSPDGSCLRVELLGAPALVAADGRRIRLERKAAALLALLAIDGPHSRAALAALLWPDAAPAAARNSLRQRLFRLHRSARLEWVVGQEELSLGAGLACDLSDAAQRLAEDADAAGGELLEGLDYGDGLELAAWVDAARARWRRRRADLLADIASRHEAANRIALALRYAQRLLADEPTLEHAHRRVMRLHYLRGDRGAALAAHAQCERVLRQELGSAPDRETAALARTIAGSGGVPLARPAQPGVGLLRPPRTIGRDGPRERLQQALARRRTVVLQGEPGIGKTRLIEELAASEDASNEAGNGASNEAGNEAGNEASKGALLVCGGQAGDGRVAYALLARLAALAAQRWPVSLPAWAQSEIARLLPALGAAPAARLDPLRLQQAFAAALSAWAAAGLRGVVVDDVHHADEASIECLLDLPSRVPALAWVFSVRSQQRPAALQAWMAADDRRDIEAITLALLEPAEVGDLLGSLDLQGLDTPAWRDALSRHSGGNPLFVLETLRVLTTPGGLGHEPGAGRLPVPAALEALIAQRLARLSAPALKLARVAALAAADFDADLAAAVLESHPLDLVAPWQELEAAQVLCAGRFSHDLVAEAIVGALPQGIAEVLHARLADCMQALGRGAARVAPHWAAAAAWPRAGAAYAQAAREARRASRRSDETALWERAADGYDRAALADLAFEARAASVECLLMARGMDAAMALVDRLDADQRSETQRLRALTARAFVCLMGGQAAQAEAAARSALHAATRLDARWPRFEASRLLAVALAQSGRADQALATIEPFRELVTREGDAEQRHNFWADYAYSLKAAQRLGDTAAALHEAMASAQAAGDAAELATLTSNLALVEGNLGRVEHALDHARRARALSDPLGTALGPPAGAIELYVSVHEGALGRYADALAGFARAHACFAASPQTIWIGLAANHQAHVLIHLGQFARASQALQWTSVATPATEARRALLKSRIHHALHQRHDEGPQQALAQLAGRDTVQRLLLQLEAACALAPDAGAAACDAVRAEAERIERLGIGMRARVLALQHRIDGGAACAGDVHDLVARLQRCHPADTYLGEAWWTATRGFDAVAQPDAASAALRHGFEWVALQALPQVPAEFRDSFLNRNTVNRDLLAAAANRLGLRLPGAPVTSQ